MTVDVITLHSGKFLSMNVQYFGVWKAFKLWSIHQTDLSFVVFHYLTVTWNNCCPSVQPFFSSIQFSVWALSESDCLRLILAELNYRMDELRTVECVLHLLHCRCISHSQTGIWLCFYYRDMFGYFCLKSWHTTEKCVVNHPAKFEWLKKSPNMKLGFKVV